MKNTLNVLLLCLSAILCVVLLTHAFKNRNASDNSIHVTGLGRKDFSSDLVVWSGSFSRFAPDLEQTYGQLKQDRETISSYLKNKGVQDREMVFNSVDIQKEYDYSYDHNGRQTSTFAGYRLTQQVEIESRELDKIENVAREITDLINTGVEFYSGEPRYYYTGLSELKIEMIAEATKDARLRADKIAENAGARVGELKYSQMGIFQIIGKNSNEDYSWGGTFNTDSREKTATITVKLQFGIR